MCLKLVTCSPEIEFQRPTCHACGWKGERIVLREFSTEELIVREGQIADGCHTMEVPLAGLKTPGD